jgi:hypothetical protein
MRRRKAAAWRCSTPRLAGGALAKGSAKARRITYQEATAAVSSGL